MQCLLCCCASGGGGECVYASLFNSSSNRCTAYNRSINGNMQQQPPATYPPRGRRSATRRSRPRAWRPTSRRRRRHCRCRCRRQCRSPALAAAVGWAPRPHAAGCEREGGRQGGGVRRERCANNKKKRRGAAGSARSTRRAATHRAHLAVAAAAPDRDARLTPPCSSPLEAGSCWLCVGARLPGSTARSKALRGRGQQHHFQEGKLCVAALLVLVLDCTRSFHSKRMVGCCYQCRSIFNYNSELLIPRPIDST